MSTGLSTDLGSSDRAQRRQPRPRRALVPLFSLTANPCISPEITAILLRHVYSSVLEIHCNRVHNALEIHCSGIKPVVQWDYRHWGSGDDLRGGPPTCSGAPFCRARAARGPEGVLIFRWGSPRAGESTRWSTAKVADGGGQQGRTLVLCRDALGMNRLHRERPSELS